MFYFPYLIDITIQTKLWMLSILRISQNKKKSTYYPSIHTFSAHAHNRKLKFLSTAIETL